MLLRRIACVITLMATTLTLTSWGVVGHRTVGQIAENHLSPKAKKAVNDLLGTESLAMVSTYADEVRSYKEFDYTAPWHYANLESGLSKEQFVNELTQMENPNIYKAIIDCIGTLEDSQKSKEDKVFALKFLVHMVGDLHQPMHMGHTEDAGGNDIRVKLGRREMNLHGLWDSSLIDNMGMTYSELAKECDKVSKQEQKQWKKDDIATWAFESYEMAGQLYSEAAVNPDFDYTYFPKYADFIKHRMAQAGIRLANTLNEIYK